MEHSVEMQDRQLNTQFGRWVDVGEWFKRACRIKEKTRPSKAVETIPVPGKWHLGIHIPVRAQGDYASAMETGMNLLAAMGIRPENAYLEPGYCVIWLKPAEFYEAKALAVEVRHWLDTRAFKTTVGDYPDPWQAGVPANLNFEQDNRNYEERSRELSNLKCMRAKLTGSTESMTVVLTRGQVEALIDLVEEYEAEKYKFSGLIEKYFLEFYHIEEDEWELEAEIRQIRQPLATLSGALRTVLRPGTTDGRGPCDSLPF